ncbi:MAG: hypothetical protein ACREGH_00005 [Minisyncoccia bacterium]
MEELIAAAVVLSGVALGNWWLFWLGVAILIILLISGIVAVARHRRVVPALRFFRSGENPILGPIPGHSWESEAVFNPAALYLGGRVHLLYRALGGDGVSRIGYAWSEDGIHFDRYHEPVFVPAILRTPVKFRNPFVKPLSYDRDAYASGGGWAGAEDPRAVTVDDVIYMSFGMFESWESMRMALTAISTEDFLSKRWRWMPHFHISPKNETHKNWVLFPEKIGGKFAVLHALTPKILIEYVDSLDELEKRPIRSNNHRGGRPGKWDGFVRGASAPPLKTPQGWLLFYHGMNPKEPHIGYKVGAMLLDLDDPTKILYRSNCPILEPTEWYENDWKPGVVYASGAIIKDSTIFLYYGGGDKTVCVATAPLEQFLSALTRGEHAVLTPAKV